MLKKLKRKILKWAQAYEKQTLEQMASRYQMRVTLKGDILVNVPLSTILQYGGTGCFDEQWSVIVEKVR